MAEGGGCLQWVRAEECSNSLAWTGQVHQQFQFQLCVLASTRLDSSDSTDGLLNASLRQMDEQCVK